MEEPEKDSSSLSLFLSDDEKILCEDECTSLYAEIPSEDILEDSEMASKCVLPPFRREDSDLWFIQAEASFHVYGVRSDFLRYNMVVCQLDPRTMKEVEDVLCSSPVSNKYKILKTAIISRLSNSDDNKLDFLDDNPQSSDLQLREQFTQFKLEDKKPSRIIDKINLLSDNNISDDIIEETFNNILQVKPKQSSSSIMPSESSYIASQPEDFLNGLIQKFTVLSTDNLQGGVVIATRLDS